MAVLGDPIEIAPYDPGWPERFREQAGRLRLALGSVALGIDHVGSTAVPGLPAKPVIDIDVSVRALEPPDSYEVSLTQLGFVLGAVDAEQRFYREPEGEPRRTHIHVCEAGGDYERRHLLFRDYLRTHPEVAAEYAAMKRELAEKYRRDRDAYTDAKGPFIREVERRAEEWVRATGWTIR